MREQCAIYDVADLEHASRGGKPTEDSDLDLLIIKNTNKKFYQRGFEVRNIINGILPVGIFVHTPQEISKSVGLRNILVHQYRKLDEKIFLFFNKGLCQRLYKILRLYFKIFKQGVVLGDAIAIDCYIIKCNI
ncbi:hypothetical protein KJ557_00335 [Patescibacteria group bacterium]|nr:hypothetical protein [Patescibacteria group bacterium]